MCTKPALMCCARKSQAGDCLAPQNVQADSSAPAGQMASPSRLTRRSMSGDMAPSTPTQTASTAGGQLRAQLMSSMSPSQLGAQMTSSPYALMAPQPRSSVPRAQMVPPVATPAGAGRLTQPASSMPPAQMVPQVAVPAHVQLGFLVVSSVPPAPIGPRVAPPASAQTVAQLASSMLPVPVLPRHLTADPALQSTAATALESSLPNLDSSIVEVDHRSARNADV